MENIKKLNEPEIPNVVGGKREESYLGGEILFRGAPLLGAISKEIGMPENETTCDSYEDDHDGKEPYKTIELELKMKCPTSKLEENNIFKKKFGK